MLPINNTGIKARVEKERDCMVFAVSGYLLILHIIISVILVTKAVMANRHPQSTIAWVFAIIGIPFIGAFFSILGGMRWNRRKVVKETPEEVFRTFLDPMLKTQKERIIEEADKIGSDIAKHMTLATNASNAPVLLRNRVENHFDGETLFPRMVEDLKKARSFIHMEYFIYRTDSTGVAIGEVLMEKARAGVEVLMLIDGMGSFMRVSPFIRKKWREAGIQFRFFINPMNPFDAVLMNYRNHRKILVIDGTVAYTGGMNIGNEYVNGSSHFPRWRDTHMRCVGEIVPMLESIFLVDWQNSKGVLENVQKYIIMPRQDIDFSEDLPLQVISSGPDSQWFGNEQVYSNLISNADKRIIIQSPYLIPDEGMLKALQNAALSGIDVQIMITGMADKNIPFWVAHTYFEDLLKAGCRIFLYQDGFLHVKNLIIDDNMLSVGTCNFDVRSFYLDYEVNLLFYNQAMVELYYQQYLQDKQLSSEFTLDCCESIPLMQKFRNSFLRLLAPIM